MTFDHDDDDERHFTFDISVILTFWHSNWLIDFESTIIKTSQVVTTLQMFTLKMTRKQLGNIFMGLYNSAIFLSNWKQLLHYTL
jgi:hypothetical protein